MKKDVVYQIGTGSINIAREIGRAVCPLCKQQLSNIYNMYFSNCIFKVEGKRDDEDDIYKKGETGEDGWERYNFDGPNDNTTWRFIQVTTYNY